MSTLAIVAIVVGAILALLFVGGLVASRRRVQGPAWERHIAEANEALEAARAEDKGWDRQVLDAVARQALERERPGFEARELHLVLVDDRPGVAEDAAHLVAAGPDGQARLVLRRDASGDWSLDRLE